MEIAARYQNIRSNQVCWIMDHLKNPVEMAEQDLGSFHYFLYYCSGKRHYRTM